MEKLSPRQEIFVSYLKGYYESHDKQLPRVRQLCTDIPTSIKELYELFPAGLSAACKIAGLPRPTCG